jgi:glycosyltransferase 2 family protein
MDLDETFPRMKAVQQPAVVVQDEVKKSQKKSAVGLVVRAVVTVLLFAFLLRSVSWSRLVSTLVHVGHTYLLMGLAAGVLCIFFSAYGWRSVLLAQNIKADLATLIDLYLVGIGFSHFLPTSMGGDAVKAFYVGRNSGNMVGAASATLMSRITSFLGMLLLALPGLAIFHRYFPSQIVIEFLLLTLLLIGAIIGAFLTSAFLPKLSSRFLKGRWTNNRMFMKFLEVGEALTSSIRRTRFMFAGTLFGMLFWIASFLNYFGYASALGLHVPLPFYVIAIPFVSIVTFLPISINGFGVREGTFVYLFSTIHVPTSTALLLVLLVDTQVLLFGLIGGCLYSVMSKREK